MSRGETPDMSPAARVARSSQGPSRSVPTGHGRDGRGAGGDYDAAVDFETRAIHAGQEPDTATGAVVTPLYLTSTYAQEQVGVHKGYDYSRTGNPTRTALETCLASLEGAAHGHAFASGIAATATIMHLLSPGDRTLTVNDVYGGTYRMFSQVYEPKGYEFAYAGRAELAEAIDERTRLVWIETPTNPLLNLVDVRAVADAAHAVGAIVVVDSTFASPYLQQPLALGADVVVHSATKYLGGHSDVVGGLVVTKDDVLAERIGFLQNAIGGVPGPWDVFLVLRGLKTLAVRMRAHCENARAVVETLRELPAVTEVLYPGLDDHPGHEIAKRQMCDFGGMVSFRMADADAALDACRRFRVFMLAESLGGVESLVEHPGRMTHLSVSGSPLEVPDDLIRLSVGIEDPDDLVADLRQALG